MMARVKGKLDSEQSYVKLFPRSIRSLQDADLARRKMEGKLKERKLGMWTGYNKWRIKKKLRKYKTKKARTLYYGALGELETLRKLTNLNNNYHVFCGVKIRFKNYIEYGGKKNLRSAQLDIAVAGPTGIYVIEVKNWSNEYISTYGGLSPHEQVDRAGEILSKRLNLPVKRIVTSIRKNINQDDNFNVSVVNVENLLDFIGNSHPVLNPKELKKAVKILSKYAKH